MRVPRAPTVSRTTGTSCTSAAAPSAAPVWCSPKQRRSRRKAASVPRTSASGRTITSRCSRASSVSSTRRAASPACSSRTPAARAAHTARGAAMAAIGRGRRRLDRRAGADSRRVRRQLPAASRDVEAGHRRDDRGIRGGSDACARRRLPRDRDACRARLSAARVPVAAQQSSNRRVRRLLRKPHPPRPRGHCRGSTCVARVIATLHPDLRHRLDRRRMGHRAVGGAGAPTEVSGR